MKKNGKEKAINERDGERIINFRPIAFFAVFLCVGVWFAYERIIGGISAWWVLFVLAAVCAVFFFAGGFTLACKRAIALCVAFLLGYSLFGLQISSFTSATEYDGEYVVTGRVWDMSEGAEYTKVVLTELTVDGEKESGKMKIYLTSPIAETLEFSDCLRFRASVRTNVDAYNSFERFRAEEIADGVCFSASGISDFTVTGHTFSLGSSVRQTMTDTIRAYMDETPAAITVALLLGNTSGIEEGLLDNIRKGGVAHIFAVSGLHIGALFAFCVMLIHKTKLYASPKLVRFALVAGVLLFYGNVCGFSASVIRAIVTCLVFYACQLIGVKTDNVETIALAAITVLLLYPSLLFAVGFQLSFLACIGIALLKRRIERLLCAGVDGVLSFVRFLFKKPKPIVKKDVFESDVPPPSLIVQAKNAVLSTAAVGLSAQLATFPVLLNVYGYVSVVGVFLNMIFVPLLSAVFGGLLVLVFLACLFPFAGYVLLKIPSVVVSAFALVFELTEFAGAFKGLILGTESVVAFYTAILVASDKIDFPKWLRVALVGLAFAAFVVCCAVGNG